MLVFYRYQFSLIWLPFIFPKDWYLVNRYIIISGIKCEAQILKSDRIMIHIVRVTYHKMISIELTYLNGSLLTNITYLRTYVNINFDRSGFLYSSKWCWHWVKLFYHFIEWSIFNYMRCIRHMKLTNNITITYAWSYLTRKISHHVEMDIEFSEACFSNIKSHSCVMYQ